MRLLHGFSRKRALLPLAMGSALLAAALPGPRTVQAQESRCTPVFVNTPVTRVVAVRTPAGGYNSYFGGGVVAHCQGQDINLRADSAEYYENTGLLHLMGAVRYTEPRLSLDSRRLTYWTAEERLLAEGDVVSVLPSGTRMTGPRAEYFRAAPDVRAVSRMIATGRPTIHLVQQDTSGRPTEPVIVIANTVATVADSLVFASGRVEITRPDMVATADSAFLDSGTEFARLVRRPTIRGGGDRPFDLAGVVIDLHSTDRELRRVVASGSAVATSEDLDLRSDTIDLRVNEGRLERAHAWGASRAHAVARENDIRADSLDIVMPGQRLREIRALGAALAQSVPDTSRIVSDRRDWITGDTIVARFDTTAVADDSERPPLREIAARVGARSFYQIAPGEGQRGAPSINYVRGHKITLAFENDELASVVVSEDAVGVYLDPQQPAPTPPGDTTGVSQGRSGAAPVPVRRGRGGAR